ncbi:hypothetical protein [Vibrio coralliilyticus]|uniref:hypothetical protein n=1 Tax=Vibrio coralliilyticus TaxID=190893 RepID=UPI001E33F830|nr:hypothetical protein [Vibrio coralliilyticus]MCC2525050.1 hypothetical protein [Vibrio coralliilyticus]
MGTLVLSLLSGLIGAAVTAYFNYRIRWNLTVKDRRETEKRLAYVYSSQLAQYDAAKFWVDYIIDNLTKSEQIELPEGDFSLSHVVAVYISEEIKKNLPNVDDKVFEQINPILDLVIDCYKLNKIEPDLLAKLPKQVVYDYLIYEGDVKALLSSVKYIQLKFASREQLESCEAKDFSSLFEATVRLFDSAHNLRIGMIAFGGVSSDEAHEVFTKYVTIFKERFGESLSQDKFLKSAKEYVDEESAKTKK